MCRGEEVANLVSYLMSLLLEVNSKGSTYTKTQAKQVEELLTKIMT